MDLKEKQRGGGLVKSKADLNEIYSGLVTGTSRMACHQPPRLDGAAHGISSSA